MTQKSWTKANTTVHTGERCPNCGEEIITHSNYQDQRFCEDCYNKIVNGYETMEDEELKSRYRNKEIYLQCVYENLTSNSDAMYWE